MQQDREYDNLNLYLLKKVIITFEDGHSASGTLTDISLERDELTLDSTAYSISTIRDIEMTGNVTYHTYAADPQKQCDIDGLYFGLNDIISDTDHSKLYFGEFSCFAACHLVFSETKICAADIRILSYSHNFYLPALTKSLYLYILQNETFIVGILEKTENEEYFVRTPSGQACPIDFDEVQDIIRLPLMNESVEITLRDGAKISGTVSAANDAIIVLIGSSVPMVKLPDVAAIRYKGTVTVNTIKLPAGTVKQVKIYLGVKEESFLCKFPFFHTKEDEAAAIEGAAATFTPGVTERSLIAKDVEVAGAEQAVSDEEQEIGIVVIAPTHTRTVGYIGREFITKTYSLFTHSSMPRGDVAFSADQLSFRIDIHSINIVRYKCSRQTVPARAHQIELVESYPVSDYAKVWIDENGAVRKMPVSVLFLDRFSSQQVSVELTDGRQVSGTLLSKNGSSLSLGGETDTASIELDDVARVFYYGTVTAYQSNNGTGFINGQYWFHVNNFIDPDQVRQLEPGVSVRFSFEVSSKGNMCAATRIEIINSTQKKGYILKFIPPKFSRKGYGFIIPSALLADRLDRNDRSGTIYFRESDIENPGTFSLNTNNCYYSVTYTEGENNTAHNIRILEELLFQKKPPKPVPDPVKVETVTEVFPIADIVQTIPAPDGPAFEYGLLITNSFGPSPGFIGPQYFNRIYDKENTYDRSQSIDFSPAEASITPARELKTNEAYLVRYVRNGTFISPSTGLEQPAIDYSYPIEIVHTYEKEQYASIRVDAGMITLKRVRNDTPAPVGGYVPELSLGESLYLKLKDGTACSGVFSGETEETYLLSDGKIIEKDSVDRLFRFGVITALDIEGGAATLNNIFDFKLIVAEPKMVSILKNQRDVVRLHVMYSCQDGKITEVCRISRECLGCLLWDAGVVTDVDSGAHNIVIDSSITHYLSVMSENVNTYVNNKTILDRAVFVKQVFHPYLGSSDAEPGLTAMAVDVRCQEEELKIQYDDGKDVYLGYRNPTIFFPVFGSSKFLSENVGQTVLVSFRTSPDLTGLEGYVEDDIDGGPDSSELVEEDSSSGIQQEPLSLLLLQREETDNVFLGQEEKLTDQEHAQRAVEQLLSKPKRLAAIKLAMECPKYDLLPNRDNLLKTEIRSRCTAIGLDANSYYGEQAFYLSTLLRYPAPARPKAKGSSRYVNNKYTNKYTNYDCLYRLFSQDFENREHLVKYVQKDRPATRTDLVTLFTRQCLQIGELVAHIVLLDKLSLDIICPLIRTNKRLADTIISYAKEIDDMISSEDVAEVIGALQERYLRDKRRFTTRTIALVGSANVCEQLKELLPNMQSRFLKLVCSDDQQRFDRLRRICEDVLDYTNKSGFSLQEQQLMNAYREAVTLEEETLSHPCKESTEFLLNSGHIDTQFNILTSVKKNISSLLDQLYQDALMPRIQCKLNQDTIQPDAKTFWLLIENGGQSDNLQPAENLHIELESFTQGFMLPKQVRLTQSRLSCGGQLSAEVEFELSGVTTGALEFGWTASFEYTTAFNEDGTTRKSVFSQESELPLQLQIDTAQAHVKNYDAVNPYAAPAHGEPLTDKQMFFGREAEKQKILGCIYTDDGTEKRFIPGSAVIIYGQKKCGKTSLANQIKNDIADDPVLSDRAILLNFGNVLDETGGEELLHRFKRNFYSMILSRFEDEIIDEHPDIVELLDDAGLEIPDLLSYNNQDTWSAQFDKFFLDFSRLDAGKHQIILFMDEFTLLCTTILSVINKDPSKASFASIPDFIKTFSQYGFIQLIIGHANMMRALDTLGVRNHTAEFAKSIEISTLDDAASRELVTKPMIDKFGFDVYGTELGKQAVDRLLELSGRWPAWLMKLCNRMFMYYKDPKKCPGTDILPRDVDAMLRDYINELLLTDFDILVREDGDNIGKMEDLTTYHYLKSAALLSFASNDRRTADSAEITRSLVRDYGYSAADIDKTRNILEARRVISVTNGGRVKINTWLLAEYIQQKNGLK